MKKLLICLIFILSIPLFSDLSQKDEALFHAVKLIDVEAVKKALVNGADTNALNIYRKTALHEAAAKGYTDIVRLLLENNANVNGGEEASDRTPLHLAAENGHTDTVRLLLENNANIDALAPGGDTPLVSAEREADIKTMQLLLDYGASIDVINKTETTLLERAVTNNHIEVVKFLLANGADVNAQSKYGYTALHKVATYDNRIAIAQLLLANGADVNITNNSGETALYKAIERSPFGSGGVKMVEFFLNHGVDVNAIVSNKEELTPLIWAAKQRDPAIVKLLLDRGADRKAIDIHGNTAYYYARESLDAKVMALLR